MAKTIIHRGKQTQHGTLSIRIKKKGRKRFKNVDVIRKEKE